MSKFSRISKLVTLICALSTSVLGDTLLAKGKNNIKESKSDNVNNENQIAIQGDKFNDEAIDNKKSKNIDESSQENSTKKRKRKNKKSNKQNQEEKKEKDKEKNNLEDNKNNQKSDVEPSESIEQPVEVVFVIDESGSMNHLKQNVVSYFNEMLESQKNLDNASDAYVTTVLFSNSNKIVHNHQEISKINNMSEEDYVPSGGTALLDALGTAINKTSKINEKNDKKVVFFVITDGEENCSGKFNSEDIKKMIEAKKELGWEFIFFGANIDSVTEAKKIGIDRKDAIDVEASKEGMKKAMGCVKRKMGCCRRR